MTRKALPGDRITAAFTAGVLVSVMLLAWFGNRAIQGLIAALFEKTSAGPRTIAEANAKQPDENILLEDLRRATHVVAAAVHDLLRE